MFKTTTEATNEELAEANEAGYIAFAEGCSEFGCEYELPELRETWLEGWYAAKRNAAEFA